MYAQAHTLLPHRQVQALPGRSGAAHHQPCSTSSMMRHRPLQPAIGGAVVGRDAGGPRSERLLSAHVTSGRTAGRARQSQRLGPRGTSSAARSLPHPSTLTRPPSAVRAVADAAAAEAAAVGAGDATSDSRVVEPGSAAADAGSGAQAAPWSWTKQWYPAAIVEQLPLDRPHGVTVLGRKLAVWNVRGGRKQAAASASRPSSTVDSEDPGWRCFDDACPHRLAPLSEGRVEGGELMCSYHGWRFGKGGHCTSIPQAADERAHATACASPRACATSYPVQVAEGLIWVWLDSSPAAVWESAAVPLPLADMLRPVDAAAGQPQATPLGGWFRHDLPIEWAHLVENLLDPAHVPWSHHGVMGPSRRELAKPINLVVLQSPGVHSKADNGSSIQSAPAAVVYRHDGALRVNGPDGPPHQLTKLQLPCLYTSTSLEQKGGAFCLNFYAVPVAPGWSRLLSRPMTSRPLPQYVRALAVHPATQWLGHLGPMDILDGDSILLATQAERLNAANGDWRHAYYMPTTADSAVIAFRKWLHTAGGGRPAWPEHHAAESAPATHRSNGGSSSSSSSSSSRNGNGSSSASSTFTSSVSSGVVGSDPHTSHRGNGHGADGGGAASALGAAALSATTASPLPPLRREVVLDRYEGHTRHCKYCSRALSWTEKGIQVAQAAIAALISLAAIASLYGVPPGWPSWSPWAALAVAAATFFARRALQRLAHRFRFVDYVHAEHD